MTGYDSKRQMAANKLWDRPSVAFDEWWNNDHYESTNPFKPDSGAYWAWAGWKAALAQPAQEPYDQTALELCEVCGWKTLIPDDGCLNCERAQPAQEHVAVVEFEPVIQGHEVWFPARCIASKIPTGTKLYTTPPKREWVGLTDEEQMALLKDSDGKTRHWLVWQVEAKLKEKNT